MRELDGTLNGLIKLALAAAVAAGVALSVFVVVNQMALDRDAADRRAHRPAQHRIDAWRALAPGSALSCLDAGAGDTVEAACEARVFADPQSTAAAVAYVGARLALLAEAAETQPRRSQSVGRHRAAPSNSTATASPPMCWPRATAARRNAAPAFAWLADAAAMKANMKAQAFDQYVSRHASAWNAPARRRAAAQRSQPRRSRRSSPLRQPAGRSRSRCRTNTRCPRPPRSRRSAS